ncbi:MAG: hypothetical protein OJF52_000144 [Nitrospira sp.]|jgi:hypothetical protein|nr:MAG: hypothetical protein OJF52_000144 [Nitrospira sp.]
MRFGVSTTVIAVGEQPTQQFVETSLHPFSSLLSRRSLTSLLLPTGGRDEENIRGRKGWS